MNRILHGFTSELVKAGADRLVAPAGPFDQLVRAFAIRVLGIDPQAPRPLAGSRVEDVTAREALARRLQADLVEQSVRPELRPRARRD